MNIHWRTWRAFKSVFGSFEESESFKSSENHQRIFHLILSFYIFIISFFLFFFPTLFVWVILTEYASFFCSHLSIEHWTTILSISWLSSTLENFTRKYFSFDCWFKAVESINICLRNVILILENWIWSWKKKLGNVANGKLHWNVNAYWNFRCCFFLSSRNVVQMTSILITATLLSISLTFYFWNAKFAFHSIDWKTLLIIQSIEMQNTKKKLMQRNG